MSASIGESEAGPVRAYPKRSELRRAEARAASRRPDDRRPADRRPPGPAGGQRPAGVQRPPAPVTAARRSSGAAGEPMAFAATASVLPLPQADAWRPAGVDLPLPRPVSDDPFRRAPEMLPAVPVAIPLLGRGRAGAARLLVMALVVGAQGVGASYLATHGIPLGGDGDVAASAFVTVDAEAEARQLAAEQAVLDQARADEAVRETQRQAAPAKAQGAYRQYQQAKAAAARIRAAAERREQALRNAQRDPRSAARLLVADRGWSSSQFSCLDSLWNKESTWNYRATNPSSGAYGIPQSLPGSKMAAAGADWQTNPVTQIRWGLDYIAERYGTPCGAWSYSQAHNSY
ncbi:hypothetical protein JCM9957A_15200 [Kineosporia succinea]|uniref:Transglycosylase-like protein with SLT domain n=1 Tax=Kineosporia succinea TaxID=84632 RepID=A0ABT9NXC2_9ACTN|nr:hypothetical protein [Kineosporia succinea]MDP9825070.1 hypothetical protein [Kineosporia succinea]